MAGDTPTPIISLRERSFPVIGPEQRLSKWLVLSFFLHAGFIVSLFLLPFLPSRSRPAYPIYTVDLVGGEKIGRTNFGTELSPAPAPKKAEAEPPTPVAETKRETKQERKVKAEKTKAVETAAPAQEKVALKESMKKQPTKKGSSKEATDESKSEAASLDSVRERLIQSAVERAKNRTEGGQKTSKGEVISSGPGEGEGAAALGQGGRGGGVVKGMEYIIYQNRMLSTIKYNWVWVGQRSNLKVIVRFNIKDNGEIVGLKVVQPSGNPSYDESVLRAVQKSSPLPAPPDIVRKDFSDVELAFRPQDLGA